MSVYVLVAIVTKRLNLDASLYTLLKIVSVTLFEKMPMQQAFPGSDYETIDGTPRNQVNLLDYYPDCSEIECGYPIRWPDDYEA